MSFSNIESLHGLQSTHFSSSMTPAEAGAYEQQISDLLNDYKTYAGSTQYKSDLDAWLDALDTLKNTQSQEGDLQKEIDALPQKIKDLQDKIAFLQGIHDLQGTLNNLQSKINDLTQQIALYNRQGTSRPDLEAQLADLQNQYNSLPKTQTDLDNQLAQAKSDLTDSQKELTDLPTQLKDLQNTEAALKDKIAGYENKYGSIDHLKDLISQDIPSHLEDDKVQLKAKMTQLEAIIHDPYLRLQSGGATAIAKAEQQLAAINDILSQ